MSWQTEVFTRLRDREWHQLGDLFEAVQHQIPLHVAMRFAMQPTFGRKEFPANSEARWRLFLSVVATIRVESDGGRFRKWTDNVRLRYVGGKTCGDCGGPVIRSSWAARTETSVVCLACSPNGELANEVPVCPTIPPPKPSPKLRLIPVVKPTPCAVPPPPPPPQREHKDFWGLGSLSSLSEIWDEYAFDTTHTDLGLPRFEDNRKLRWTLHRAIEAGAAEEFKRMTLFRADEFQELGGHYHDLQPMFAVFTGRAARWIEFKTPALSKKERDGWAHLLAGAFRYGSMVIVSVTLAGRLHVIADELNALLAKLEPKPQRPRILKHRWRPAFGKIVARWRVH